MYSIIDYKLNINTANIGNTMSGIYKVELITSDNRKIIDEQLLATKETIESIEKQNIKQNTLDLLYKIHTEHNKQKLLGLSIPIYTIGCSPNSEITIILIGFNLVKKNETFIVPSYVESILINNRDCVDTLELRHKVTLSSIKEDVKIKGLENVTYLTDEVLERLGKEASKTVNGIVELKYIKQMVLTQFRQVPGIKRIIFHNTCELREIDGELLARLPDLTEITLCKGIKTIRDVGTFDIDKDLRTDRKTGYKYTTLTSWSNLKHSTRKIIFKYNNESESSHV